MIPLLRRPLHRRTMLRGLGATIALPFLEAMTPSKALAQARGPAQRLMYFYVPCGVHMESFVPATVGALDVLPPMLRSLEPVKQQVHVLTGVQCTAAFDQGDGPGDHARGTGTFLTAVHPQKSESRLQNGVSADQIAARAWRGLTPLPSLQIGCEAADGAGVCDVGYSCAYAHNISWASPTTPLPKDTNPQTVFDRLFGANDLTLSPEERAKKRRRRQSVLDFVGDDARRLQREVSTSDRVRLDEYLTGVRELETRITAQADNSCAVPQAPGGAVADVTAYIDTMLDLVVAAYRCDLVRAVTFMLGNAGSGRSYGFLGHPGAHHEYSHHSGTEEKLTALAAIGRFEVERYARFAAALAAIDEGGVSVLDNSALVFGSELSDGDRHNHDELPLMITGGYAGTLKTGLHSRTASGTELGDVHLTLLQKAGLTVNTFGEDGRRPVANLS